MLSQQRDAMALKRRDDLCPHLVAHLTVAQLGYVAD
jgi:hypothetical protein